MDEKILFEMRIERGEHGTRVEINAAPEWYDYHRPRRRRLVAWAEGSAAGENEPEGGQRQPAAADLRRTLDSLQNIYNDLYGSLAEAGAPD